MSLVEFNLALRQKTLEIHEGEGEFMEEADWESIWSGESWVVH